MTRGFVCLGKLDKIWLLLGTWFLEALRCLNHGCLGAVHWILRSVHTDFGYKDWLLVGVEMSCDIANISHFCAKKTRYTDPALCHLQAAKKNPPRTGLLSIVPSLPRPPRNTGKPSLLSGRVRQQPSKLGINQGRLPDFPMNLIYTFFEGDGLCNTPTWPI